MEEVESELVIQESMNLTSKTKFLIMEAICFPSHNCMYTNIKTYANKDVVVLLVM